jgi:5-formyltetrahydrofolate cyclo-ligase
VTKAELRHNYLAKRQLLSIDERERKTAQIVEKFFNHYHLSKINVLHCFISIERFGEVDTRPIFQRVWSDHPDITTVVPRINRETEELESLLYGADTELVHDRWQIGEPVHNDRVESIEVDLVLVPLLCYDRTGHRIGYGKGYYDRFLAKCRPDCQKIGLSMFPPIDEISDAHEGDIKLDACITPTEVIKF